MEQDKKRMKGRLTPEAHDFLEAFRTEYEKQFGTLPVETSSSLWSIRWTLWKKYCETLKKAEDKEIEKILIAYYKKVPNQKQYRWAGLIKSRQVIRYFVYHFGIKEAYKTLEKSKPDSAPWEIFPSNYKKATKKTRLDSYRERAKSKP